MTEFGTLLSSEGVHRLGWALVHSTWQLALLALVLALVLAVLRGRSANLRYLIACAGVAMMPVLPAVTYGVVSGHVGPESPAAMASRGASPAGANELAPPRVAPLEPGAASGEAIVSSAPNGPARQLPAASPTAPLRPGATVALSAQQLLHALSPWMPWLALAWFVGVLALSTWHLGGWLTVQRLKCSGTIGRIEPVVQNFRSLVKRLGVSRPVRLLQSTAVGVPVVIGWLRPVILMPAAMLSGLSPSELTAVVAHELAHVRRHDYLVNLLQTMVETLLFYHPAVWWLSRRVRIEREHCCDDLAAAVCGSRIEYAAALAAVERARSAPALAMAVVGSRRAGPTLQRVRRLLGVSVGEPAGPRAWLGGILASVLVMTLGAAAALPLPEGSVEGTPRELPGDSAADPATEAATPANSAGISEPVPFLPFPEGESEMRRFHQSMFLVPAAVVLMAGSAESQVGGAGGFGGGGGGGYVSGGGPGSILRLITYPEVQRDLRLEEQQKRRIDKVLGNLQALERKLLEEPRDLPGPERGRAMDERMKRLEKENDKARKEIVGILTSDQAARLNQVSLQNRGAEMLFDREIVKALGITKAQQNRLEAMRREVQEKERDLMMEIPSLPPEKRGEAIPSAIRKIGQIQDEVAKRMLEDVLTARQKGKLKDLQGEKLELAPRYVPRAGGGAGGFGGSSSGGSSGGGSSDGASGGSSFGTSRSFQSSSEASGEARAGERAPR